MSKLKPSKYAGQITTSKSRYVETGKELPPTNPPGPITHIHAGCECVESGLIAKWGNKLNPITCALANRKPVMSFSSQDRLSCASA